MVTLFGGGRRNSEYFLISNFICYFLYFYGGFGGSGGVLSNFGGFRRVSGVRGVRGSGGVLGNSGGFRVVPGDFGGFRVVPGDFGGFRDGSRFYRHPKNNNISLLFKCFRCTHYFYKNLFQRT